MNYVEIEEQQRQICKTYKAEFVATGLDSKVGIALETLSLKPLNALRHLPEGNTSGWYIWGGEKLSSAPDFFDPLHTKHLQEKCPEILKFLGLPPGYRFLVAGDYMDVWFDSKLLEI